MKKISKNFLALFISDTASHIIGFFATIYIARLLAAEGFGQISYGLAFLSYALLFANPGLTIIGAREVAKDHNNRRLIEEILGLRLLLAFIVFLLFIIGLLLIPGRLITKQIIFYYIFSIFPIAILLEFIFQGREEMEYIGVARLCQYGVYIILLFILLKSSRAILLVPISSLFSYAAAAGFLIFVFVKKYGRFTIRFSMSFGRSLLVAAIPVGLATILNQVYLSLPPIVLGVFHSKAEVGLFSAGFKIIVMFLIIDRVCYYIFYPVITKQYIHTPERIGRSLSFIVRLLFTITIPLTLGSVVLADRLINLIYGAEYQGAVTSFQILLLYFLIAPITTIFGYGLVAINQERRFFKIIAFTATLSFILIIFLGVCYKGSGAALALFVSELVCLILMNRQIKKFIYFKSLKFITKPLLATFLMAVTIFLLRSWNIFVLFIIGILIYVVTFYLLQGFTRNDLKYLRDAFFEK